MNNKTTLSNKEEHVLHYMKQAIRNDNPTVDLRDDGVFAETFLGPMVSIMKPVMELLDRTRLMRSLENAKYLTNDEVDAIALEYDEVRIAGERSTVIGRMIFNDLPDDGFLVIPAGGKATSITGHEFKVLATSMYDELTIAQFYDPETFKYSIPVEFVSIDVGANKNIDVGDLSQFDSTAPQGFESITNLEPGIGGRDEEDNVSFAQRILSSLWGVNLGVERGYQNFINSFDGVEECLVVGYRHPLMKRDVIGNVEIPGVKMHPNITQKHWGSKIDIYVRGVIKEEVLEELPVKRNKEGENYIILGKKPIHEIIGITVAVESIGEGEEIEIERLVVEEYSFIRDEGFETMGTLEEESYIVINDDRVLPGMKVNVLYTYNRIPEHVDYTMYHNETKHRPPTADVKVKIAGKKYLFGSVAVGLEQNTLLHSADKSRIRRQVANDVNSLGLGTQLQLSDLIESIYGRSSQGMAVVDYIDLPYKFILTEKKNRYIYYCMSMEQREIFEGVVVPEAVKESFEAYKADVTTYDFFDILYIISRKVNDKLDILATEGFDLMNMIPSLKLSGQTFVRSGAIKELSPPVIDIPEHEHCELGNFFVYDHKEVTKEDWENKLYLLRNISQTEDNQDATTPKHLILYILMLVHIFNGEGKDMQLYTYEVAQMLGLEDFTEDGE